MAVFKPLHLRGIADDPQSSQLVQPVFTLRLRGGGGTNAADESWASIPAGFIPEKYPYLLVQVQSYQHAWAAVPTVNASLAYVELCIEFERGTPYTQHDSYFGHSNAVNFTTIARGQYTVGFSGVNQTVINNPSGGRVGWFLRSPSPFVEMGALPNTTYQNITLQLLPCSWP